MIEIAQHSPAGCGAPSVWSADGRAIVLSCIGCGRIDTAQQCAGTCGEYRLEIVPAATHDAAIARLDAERRRAQVLGAATERLADHASTPDGWQAAYRALQADAREVLRDLATAPGDNADDPEQPLAVWSCGCCGRVEAEAACIGVCADERLEVVRGSVHDGVRAELEVVGSRVGKLNGLVRQLAYVTPRPGGWEAGFRALQDRARELAAAPALASPPEGRGGA